MDYNLKNSSIDEKQEKVKQIVDFVLGLPIEEHLKFMADLKGVLYDRVSKLEECANVSKKIYSEIYLKS